MCPGHPPPALGKKCASGESYKPNNCVSGSVAFFLHRKLQVVAFRYISDLELGLINFVD